LAKDANKNNPFSSQSELMPLTPSASMIFKMLLTAAVLIQVMQIHALSDSEKHRKTEAPGPNSLLQQEMFSEQKVTGSCISFAIAVILAAE